LRRNDGGPSVAAQARRSQAAVDRELSGGANTAVEAVRHRQSQSAALDPFDQIQRTSAASRVCPSCRRCRRDAALFRHPLAELPVYDFARNLPPKLTPLPVRSELAAA